MKHTERDEPRPAGYQFSRKVTAISYISYSLVLMAAVGANDGRMTRRSVPTMHKWRPSLEYLDANVGAETALARSAAPEAIPRRHCIGGEEQRARGGAKWR